MLFLFGALTTVYWTNWHKLRPENADAPRERCAGAGGYRAVVWNPVKP
jgi:hypothetical protein